MCYSFCRIFAYLRITAVIARPRREYSDVGGSRRTSHVLVLSKETASLHTGSTVKQSKLLAELLY